MRRLTLISLCLWMVTWQDVRAAGPDDEVKYQSMVAAAKAGDPNINWQALRFAYADRPGVNVMDDGMNPVRAKMLAAHKPDDFAAILQEANLIIDSDYVDGQAHLVAFIAYQALGHQIEADRERVVSFGLLKSIQTGDGLSEASPFTVINVREEYELMFALKRTVKNQILAKIDGHSYDILDTLGADGGEVKFYFLIDRVLAAENKLLNVK